MHVKSCLPQSCVFIVWVIHYGSACGQFHTCHGGHSTSKHSIYRNIAWMQESEIVHIKWDVSFCTIKSKSKRQEFLTRACVVLDPLQELFLRKVTELSYNAPLTLQVGKSLDCHDGQYSYDCHLEFKLLSYPTKQLQMKRQRNQNISESNRILHLKVFAQISFVAF